ncbi:MAG: NAD(P)/FAD-dependent oxidoreductase [Raineya sp.]|nr:FAD-dependent monooxygenase [Raineya sp.]MDW8295474.1 NAD(P)/FAD-dependent oxidoreductase [Raineya sp.]
MKKRILIVGGGIAGTSLACFLDEKQFDITIAERFAEWKPIGYVVGLWQNGIRVLEKYDIYSELRNKGVIAQYQDTLDEKGNVLKKVSFEKLNQEFGATIHFFHRADLHKALMNKAQNKVTLKLNTFLENLIFEQKSVRVLFNTNESIEYDLVVGADGIHSSVRSFISPQNSLFTYPSTFFSFLAEVPENIRGSIEMFGVGSFFGIYPYDDKKVGIYCSLHNKTAQTISKWNELPNFEKIRTAFQYYQGLVPTILKQLNENTPIFQDSVREVEFSPWFCGNAICIGDAAHALLPTTGQGVAAAIQDAYHLANLLNKNVGSHHFEKIFSDFENMRTKHLTPIRKSSRFVNKLIVNPYALVCVMRNFAAKHVKFYDTENKIRSFFQATQID